jgi:capsular polysaccharide transport system permease protein
MQLPEAQETQPANQSLAQKISRRLKSVNRLFLLTVVIPTTFSIIYYGFLASDVYISESHFVIRNTQKQNPVGLSAIFQGAGFVNSQEDNSMVQDFIQSRDALKALDSKLGLAASYGGKSIDRISRFAGLHWDKSFEALHRYYQKKIVTISQETSSSISTLQVRSFSADQAALINEQLLVMSEQLVNKLNDRSRQDMIRFVQNEVAQAETKARVSSQALSSFRNQKGVFDPEKQSVLQLQQVSKLQDELIATKAQLTQIRLLTKNNPQVPILQKRVDLLQAEIAAETAKVTGGERSLSGRAAEYERLVLERSFADKQLATALASLEQARNEALRKQLYLERIVQPVKPDKAMEPRRFVAIFATFAVGMIGWGILTMLIAGVREHHD